MTASVAKRKAIVAKFLGKVLEESGEAGILQELFDSLTAAPGVEAEGADADAAGAATGVLPSAALPHLADLIRILKAKSKGQMCLECTCGDKGPGAKLEDRAAACVSGECAACGFAKSWTNGLRPMLIEKNGQVDWAFIEGVPNAFLETVHWQNYATRVKMTPGKKSGVDKDWEEAKKSKELFVEAKSGTLFDFLDEFESAVGKHVPHRSTLSRQKASSLAFERERRPGGLFGDIDFAENLSIEEVLKIQSEHWSTNQCTLFIGVWQWLDVGP
jgi:hypothetical protein